MHKVCATCQRENPADAFQCYACRSRAFGSHDPAAAYRATQRQITKTRRIEERKRSLDEAIDSCDHVPGQRHRLLIAVCSTSAALVGLLLPEWTLGRACMALAGIGFSWLALTYRISLVRKLFVRQRKQSP